MLSLEQLSFDGETVMTSPGSTPVTLRDGSGEAAPEGDGWRTASTTRRWRYALRDEIGSILYLALVEDMTVVNTSTGREFRRVSYELDYCGADRFARCFSATGVEPDPETAATVLREAADSHHLRRVRMALPGAPRTL